MITAAGLRSLRGSSQNMSPTIKALRYLASRLPARSQHGPATDRRSACGRFCSSFSLFSGFSRRPPAIPVAASAVDWAAAGGCCHFSLTVEAGVEEEVVGVEVDLAVGPAEAEDSAGLAEARVEAAELREAGKILATVSALMRMECWHAKKN
jgi:hypothetical protein